MDKLTTSGKTWWRNTFDKAASVPLDDLVKALKKKFPTEAETKLKRIVVLVIDPHDDNGRIDAEEWDWFLCRFGPFEKSIEKAFGVFDSFGMIQPWFHGTMSREQCSALCQSRGQFLVRFASKGRDQDRLSLAYVSLSKNKFRWVHLVNTPKGYNCSQLPDSHKHFPTISHFIEYFRVGSSVRPQAQELKLQYPVESQCRRECQRRFSPMAPEDDAEPGSDPYHSFGDNSYGALPDSKSAAYSSTVGTVPGSNYSANIGEDDDKFDTLGLVPGEDDDDDDDEQPGMGAYSPAVNHGAAYQTMGAQSNSAYSSTVGNSDSAYSSTVGNNESPYSSSVGDDSNPYQGVGNYSNPK